MTIDRQATISGWHERRVVSQDVPKAHAMTVDVEDYFQVEALASVVSPSDWSAWPARVETNTNRILELFSASGTRATFFTLGWVAERFPALVRRIVSAGHELASHGLSHVRADRQSREVFLADSRRARLMLEDIGGAPVKGYRAASFSITGTNLWAFEVLQEAGYCYSSSTNPIRHDLYGIPDQPRSAFRPLPDSQFLEIPVSTARRFGANWPSGGGGYFRLLPYRLFKANLEHALRNDGGPLNFYFHPWEIDPDQPRIPGLGFKSATRHYLNLSRTYGRLTRLLRDFVWRRVDEVYPVNEPADAVDPPSAAPIVAPAVRRAGRALAES